MGNGISHEKQDLRDREAELLIPRNISYLCHSNLLLSIFRRVISNFILAMLSGTFYPCIILRSADSIPEGYVVYFFHLKNETEVPSNSIIGNLWTLINCEISFTDSLGNICTGRVVGTDFKRSETFDQPINFFIHNSEHYTWVSFPYIFMTREQAGVICC